MATPLGTNTATSITRRFVMPELVDSIYNAVLLLYRFDRANKKRVQGGLHIEVPIIASRFQAGGPYTGFDLLDTTPQDVLKNAAWDWKQYHVPVTLDGRTMLRNDSPEAIANIVEAYMEIAREEMEEQVGTDLYSDAVSNLEAIDGLRGAVDDGTTAATYAGLTNRTTVNAFWSPDSGAFDTTTTTLTLDALQSVFGACTDGARHPTILVTTQANYNRYWSANQIHQRFPTEPAGMDEQLAKAGFTNLLFNNVPLAVDRHCPANNIFFLNEEYIDWVVHPSRDFYMEDFRQPVNQDAMTGMLLLMANLVVKNVKRQGRMTAVAA